MREKFCLLVKLAFCFMVASFIGWLYEITAGFLVFGFYFDRGVLHLPFCPIYGFGMLALLLIFRKTKSWLLVFFGSIGITTLLELIVSYLAQYLFHTELWNYGLWPLNFEGRISLISSLIFGLMAIAFIKGIWPLTNKLFTSKAKLPLSVAVGVGYLFSIVWELFFLFK